MLRVLKFLLLFILTASIAVHLAAAFGMCICPASVTPVCATDNVTYDNPCLVECENRMYKWKKLEIKCYTTCGQCPYPHRNPYPWSGKRFDEDYDNDY
ncbi:kazal-type serine protease inhibitor domain-containing protein [Phthorimaea operculella]|nr:kazal-type serine protease inhibitor domain-containing protein [Phthorimaea operculella]